MDETHIRRALDLAAKGRGLTSPNPLVGAVVVSESGEVVGEGWHVHAGAPHAEVEALEEAGTAARGGTLYCSLEPCNHFGRTPPCTGAIVDAGIARVVAAVRDPNPVVDGRGLEALRSAGVAVTEGVLAGEAARLNEAFFKHARTGLPFVTLKLAATLDGKIAASDGSSTWITGEAAREDVHRMRGAADAVMVGSGTVLADDPRLTVRDSEYRGEPVLRVVLDGRGRTPPDAAVLAGGAPTLVATTERAPVATREAWRTAGADVLIVEPAGDGGVEIAEVLEALGKRDVQSVLLEGGSQAAFAALEADVVDKVVVFLAPKLLGGAAAPGMLGGAGFPTLAGAQGLDVAGVERIGPDIKVEAYVHRDR